MHKETKKNIIGTTADLITADVIKAAIQEKQAKIHQATVEHEKRLIYKTAKFMLDHLLTSSKVYTLNEDVIPNYYTPKEWTIEAIQYAKENGFELKPCEKWWILEIRKE